MHATWVVRFAGNPDPLTLDEMLAFLGRTRRIAAAGAWNAETNDLYAQNFGVRNALDVLRGGTLGKGVSDDTRIVAYATYHCSVRPVERDPSAEQI